MDKYQLIKKIHNMEGLTDDERSALLELLRTQKKYGLVWEDKPENVEERLRDELPVLTEVKERAIISEDQEAPNHILIEGDNLEALTTLAYTHAGKIDVIYIDPPYNTGKKDDFIYNDKYVDKEDEYRHSKWLSFMSKRLVIAKQLLSEKGVIFISIDENEMAQLKLLGDSVFNNFVGQWNWYKSATPPSLSKKIKRNIEYILCWQAVGNDEKFKGVQKISSSNDPFTKIQNSFKELRFPRGTVNCNMPDGEYESGIYGTTKYPNELLTTLVVKNGINDNDVTFRNRFIWLQSTLDENISNGLYIELSKSFVLSYKRKDYTPEVPPNLIDDSVGVETTENAGRQLETIFSGKKVFDFPKPVSLIKYILNFSYYKNIVILDFFAGSGTTLHATMQLNAEDGGHRQCILVTNNENNICEEVTYERNKRVIQGYTTPKGVEVEGLKSNTLRYYKTDFVSRDRDAKTMRRLVDMSTDMLCIKEDLYKEVYTFGSQKTRKRAFRYFAEGDKKMLVIYREELVEDLVEEIFDMDIAVPIKVYVFSPSEDPWGDLFEGVAEKVELCALPQAIYNAYRRILPKRGQSHKRVVDEEEKEKTKDAQQLNLF